ncbi:acetoin utilization protein AcuC [Nocardioides sp.]|uniref:acetoin utilization protein AcuC n=1 Tax=Nocardioides sp. TaxID=35761 RepID=UPI00199BA57C|nr:acetoin utilization protein AcuC [Nocardioides sp.]MBC7275382.1 acetoin utilization protein AcuC [Nocardioides sp.]
MTTSPTTWPNTCQGHSTVVFDDSLADYDFGPTHPMAPIRVDLTMRLADELGILDRLKVVEAPMGTPEQLLTIHDESYIEAVIKAGRSGDADIAHGLGTEDDPVFPHIHDASAHIVGASIEACRQVYSGESLHSANLMGGLHHAMRGRAAGFCIYNDVAAGIQWLLDQGVKKVAYVDVDVHHGDGVERAFWNDPRVLTISLHETGQLLFPGTGFAEEVGGPGAEGSAVNVALPPGTADHGWLRAFHAVVPDLIREFQPEILVTQQGCDSHTDDPLADLALSVDGQRATYVALHDLAHEVSAGKWVAFGGGGYAVVDVVPRAWTHLLALVSGNPLEPTLDVPGGWREHVRTRLGRVAPLRMTDGREPAYRDWGSGYDPGTWLDRQVHATRTAVFPLHGLDPMP